MNTNILIVLFTTISIALYLNIIATYHVWNADAFSATQRVLQSFLIWFIPILGAIIIINFHLSDKDYVNDQKSRKGKWHRAMSFISLGDFEVKSNSNICGDSHDTNSHGCGNYDSGAGDGEG